MLSARNTSASANATMSNSASTDSASANSASASAGGASAHSAIADNASASADNATASAAVTSDMVMDMVDMIAHTAGANDPISDQVNATDDVTLQAGPEDIITPVRIIGSIEIDDNDDCPPLIPNVAGMYIFTFICSYNI
jgi:hypothetical protein